MRTPQLRRFPSPNRRGISAVVLLTTVGLTLAAQVAGAQTTAGSTVAPLNPVRAANRHQTRQLGAKDVLLGETTPRRELPTSNSPRSIPLSGAALKSALHDARFGEAGSRTEMETKIKERQEEIRRLQSALEFRAGLQGPRFGETSIRGGSCYPWGCGENSPVVDGAALVGPTAEVRAVRRHRATQVVTKDVAIEKVAAPEQRPTPNVQRSTSVARSDLKSALHDARFGEASIRSGNCLPWACGENSSVVDGASLVGPLAEVRAVRRHRATQVVTKDVAIEKVGAPEQRPTPNVQRSTSVPRSGLKSALHDTRFGEAWGSQLNSPHVGGAAIF